MMFYCEVCKCQTRHKWNEYANHFECMRKTKKHGWNKVVKYKEETNGKPKRQTG